MVSEIGDAVRPVMSVDRSEIGARIDPDTKFRLDEIAVATDRSLAAVIRIALREFIARYDRQVAQAQEQA